MEASWLAAAALVPLFFSTSSLQVFEPDKDLILKFLAIFSGAAWFWTRLVASRRDDSVFTIWDHPLVKPVLALTVIYLLSTVFSIVPSLSWLGSNRRGQGTLALLGYVMLFLIVVTELRRKEQMKRLQFVVVLTSVPVSAYPILQQMHLDPFPWDDIFTGRFSGTMGNPIFLGGYLVMVIPITFCSLASMAAGLGRDRQRKSGQIAMGVYCAALVLQVSALLCTQSRGPVAGLVLAVYLCASVFFVGNRIYKNKDKLILPLAAAGLGLVVPFGLIIAARPISKFPGGVALLCLALLMAVAGTLYYLFWRSPGGRRWFWLTWIVQPLALVLLFMAFSADKASLSLPSALGRFSEVSGGSTRVRISLWNTTVQWLRTGSPAVLPDGTRDPYYFLRLVLGYGPESAWLPVNMHAVPSLFELQSAQIADRTHNETFDNLMTVGLAGSIAFLVLVGTVFFHALRLLGFARDGREKKLSLAFSSCGALLGIAVPWLAGFSYLAGVGAGLGLLAGVVAFIAWNGFRGHHVEFETGGRQLLVLGLMGAMVAHLVEIGVGIAVPPTRLYFFMIAALIAVHSLRDFDPKNESVKSRSPKSSLMLPSTSLSYGISAAFIFLCLSWCFTFNTAAEQSAWSVFVRTWFSGGLKGLPISSALLLAAVTGGFGVGMMHAERKGHSNHGSAFAGKLIPPILFMIGTWALMGILSASFWTAPDSSAPVNVSAAAESRITLFVVALWVLLVIAAFTLAVRIERKEIRPIRISESLTALLLAVCASVCAYQFTLRPAWADSAGRVAEYYEGIGDPASAVQLLERATRLVPHEPVYWLSLGRTQSAMSPADLGRQARAAETLRHALDLNPVDSTALRTLGTFHMQIAEYSSDPSVREREIQTALSYLKKTSLLSPNSPDAYNEIGRCYFLRGEHDKAESLYRKSLKISPRHSRTYMFIGEMHYRRQNLEAALKSFGDAVKVDSKNIEARKNLGSLLALLGRREEAIQEYLKSLKIAPRDSQLLARLSVLHFLEGDYGKGLEFGDRAYDATPAAQRGSRDAFIEKLKNQGN